MVTPWSIRVVQKTIVRNSIFVAKKRCVSCSQTSLKRLKTALRLTYTEVLLAVLALGLCAEAAVVGGQCTTLSCFNTSATGLHATALGDGCVASGKGGTALGHFTTAGPYGTAMGYRTVASGSSATAFGYFTSAAGEYSTVFGNYIGTTEKVVRVVAISEAAPVRTKCLTPTSLIGEPRGLR